MSSLINICNQDSVSTMALFAMGSSYQYPPNFAFQKQKLCLENFSATPLKAGVFPHDTLNIGTNFRINCAVFD